MGQSHLIVVEGGGMFQGRVPRREEVVGHLTQPSNGFITSTTRLLPAGSEGIHRLFGK